jgi:Mo25-like
LQSIVKKLAVSELYFNIDTNHLQEMYNYGVLLMLLRNLLRIDFEGKKDAAQIFNNMLRRQTGTRTPTVEYICTTPEILFTLCKGTVTILSSANFVEAYWYFNGTSKYCRVREADFDTVGC